MLSRSNIVKAMTCTACKWNIKFIEIYDSIDSEQAQETGNISMQNKDNFSNNSLWDIKQKIGTAKQTFYKANMYKRKAQADWAKILQRKLYKQEAGEANSGHSDNREWTASMYARQWRRSLSSCSQYKQPISTKRRSRNRSTATGWLASDTRDVSRALID